MLPTLVQVLDPRFRLPTATAWLLASCEGYRGQELSWNRSDTDVLVRLGGTALIHSVESSNRIEGVEAEPGRLTPLLEGRSRPRDGIERELLGYKRALERILAAKKGFVPSSASIRDLHARCLEDSVSDGGAWKTRNNDIVEFSERGERHVRFRPLEHEKVPRAIADLCETFEAQSGSSPPLLLIGAFVFDFLCIHPFRDGNGRVSRLLTTALLLRFGYESARLVSLERIVETRKSEYYEALRLSSEGWHSGRPDPLPWINFFLSVVRESYRDVESKLEAARGTEVSLQSVLRKAVLRKTEPFSLAELHRELPTSSLAIAKKVLADLKAEGLISLQGRGRGARWKLRRRR